MVLRIARLDPLIEAIARLAVRGAPTLGVAGAMGVALLARFHPDDPALVRADAARHAGVPFLVVAPESTVDLSTQSGAEIDIEERVSDEVVTFRGVRSAPAGTRTLNPAFDVTPVTLITAIVTDRRVIRLDRGETPAEP